MHDVVPVEYGQETINRSYSVARPGRNVLPQDPPSVLNGANERILVRVIHDDTAIPQRGKFKPGKVGFVPATVRRRNKSGRKRVD
jgi:hypothetical protein